MVIRKDINTLYISYDGLTDSLGQSQVLPYLCGLSKLGYTIHIISCEKPEIYAKSKSAIEKIIADNNLIWHPLTYTKKPAVLSTLLDIFKIRKKAFSLHKKENFQIVHCRSYITALVGLKIKTQLKVLPWGEDLGGDLRFIFDMRGFYADERVDGGLWNLKNPIFKLIYKFFKKKETEFLQYADYSISLTEAGKKEIHSWKNIPNQPVPIDVIPCCADLELFSPDKIDKNIIANLKQKSGVNETDYILSYLGSIGTWYMLDEMLDFFKVLQAKKTNSKFLFITHDTPESILIKVRKKQINENLIIIVSANRNEVPHYLALSNASIFFIKPCFSKKASSPTKLAETMAMNIPIICNSGVGDVAEIIKQTNCGVVISHFNISEYENAIISLDKITLSIAKESLFTFSLNYGVKKYHSIYQSLLSE
jgi:glycosyltransferase involved in cell wall biosynthesis